jgi:hypothetical protein
MHENPILEFLTIDHINGGGNKHRQQIRSRICHWLKKNNYPEGFQVLCFDCNLGRSINGGICPHISGGTPIDLRLCSHIVPVGEEKVNVPACPHVNSVAPSSKSDTPIDGEKINGVPITQTS